MEHVTLKINLLNWTKWLKRFPVICINFIFHRFVSMLNGIQIRINTFFDPPCTLVLIGFSFNSLKYLFFSSECFPLSEECSVLPSEPCPQLSWFMGGGGDKTVFLPLDWVRISDRMLPRSEVWGVTDRIVNIVKIILFHQQCLGGL